MRKLILPLCAITLLAGCDELLPAKLACDERSADMAAELINEKTDLNGALELLNPHTLRKEPNHVYCRATSNIDESSIDYEVIKKSNGDIYVLVNVYENAVKQILDNVLF